MDTGSTPDLPAAIFETGHFGAVPHPPIATLHSWTHELRSRAKALAKGSDPHACWREGFTCTKYSTARECPVLSTLPPSARHRHFEEQLLDRYRSNPRSFQTKRLHAPSETRVSARRLHTRSRYYPNELDNDVALARSGVPLPGERNHQRCPSFERQDAFYDQSTSKGKIRVRRSASDDAQVAELYHKGLLYNSAEDVKSTFDLNSIRHSEPTYIIRSGKSGNRSARHSRPNGSKHSLEQPLRLDLSFSDIGDDWAITQYFLASQQTSPGEMTQHALPHDSGESTLPPLRVIYELAGSQGSVDVDASQPPDLILDEEFDMLSDSEMQDTPRSSQQSATDPSSAAWVMVGDDL